MENVISKWHSFHIFFSDIHQLLAECITPLSLQLYLKKKDCLFFIRYTEGGPHVRLRIQAELGDYLVLEEVAKYIQKNPSIKRFTYPNDFPNNSIQRIVYEPELYRYGGTYGIQLAEMHFVYSSRTILSYFKRGAICTYADGIKIAIQMHLALGFYHCNGSVKECIEFFKYVFFVWKDYSTLDAQNYIASLKVMYEKQQEIIDFLIDDVWYKLKNSLLFDDTTLNEWSMDMRRCHNAMEGHIVGNRLTFPEDLIVKPQRKYWTLLQSYLHMTNNRLGISNYDEKLLIFYIVEGLINYYESGKE